MQAPTISVARTTSSQSDSDIENQRVPTTTATASNDKAVDMWDALMPCLSCLFCLFSVGIAGALIANAVFGIMALVETSRSDLQDDCPDTHLWEYLAVILIMGLNNNRSIVKQSGSEDRSWLVILFTFLVQFGLLCWGSYELWGVDCVDDIDSNLIYTMAYINVVAGWVIFALFALIATVIFSKSASS